MKVRCNLIHLSLIALIVALIGLNYYIAHTSSFSSSTKLPTEVLDLVNTVRVMYPSGKHEVRTIAATNHLIVWYKAHEDADTLLINYQWTYQHATSLFKMLHANQTLVIIMDDLHVPMTRSKHKILIDDMIGLWSHLREQSRHRDFHIAYMLLSSCMDSNKSLRKELCNRRILRVLLRSNLNSLQLAGNQSEISASASATASACITSLNTRKYDAACMPYPEQMFSILVTGLGGSGTHFVNNLLRWMNIEVSHEVIDNDGSVSWIYAVNDVVGGVDYPFKSPILHSSLWSPRFRHVSHLTRCPLKQIASLTTHLDVSYAFIYRHLKVWAQYHHGIQSLLQIYPQLSSLTRNCNRQADCNLHRAMLAWILWSYLLDSYVDSRLKVDEPMQILNYVCQLLIEDLHVIAPASTADTSRSYSKCRWYLAASTNERQAIIHNASRDISSGLACAASIKSHAKKRSWHFPWKWLSILPSISSHDGGLRSSSSNCALDMWSKGYRDSAPVHHDHPILTVDDLIAKDRYLTDLIITIARNQGYEYLC